MNYNKYIQSEKDYTRYCNQNDITVELECTDKRLEKIYDELLMMALDEEDESQITQLDIDNFRFLNPNAFQYPYYNSIIWFGRYGLCKYFGITMKRRDAKLCAKAIRNLGMVKFCSIYRGYDAVWERNSTMSRKRATRQAMHDVAKRIIDMNESDVSRLQKYIKRYHLTYNSKISKELLKSKESEETDFFHLKLQILRGIIRGMREELIRSGYCEE